MAWTDFRPGRSACAAAYICLMLPVSPFGRLVANVHQAFWCSVIEGMMLCPVVAITQLSKRRITPRVLRWLAPLLGLLWSEVVCAGAARWVQLLVAHASVSSSLAGASVALDQSRESPYGIMAQGLFYLCVIQIAHGITGVMRPLQAMVGSEADIVIANAVPLYDEPRDFEEVLVDFAYAMFERLVWVYLAGQTLLCGCLVQLFTNMALYLERMAAGTILTALSNAVITLGVCRFPIFVLWSSGFLLVICMILWSNFEDAHDEADGELHRRRAEIRRGGPPPAGVRRRLPTPNAAIPNVMLTRLALRAAWALEEYARLLVPRLRHARGLGSWLCPEVAVLLPEDVRRRLYAAALVGVPSSALAAVWGHGLLRRRHIELWRRAELTTDFVLLSDNAVGMTGAGWAPSGLMLFLGRVASLLVRGVEAAFGVCLFVGGFTMICTRSR